MNNILFTILDAESPPNSQDKLNEEVIIRSNKNQTDNEFVSDSYDHEHINADEIKSDLKQLNLDSKKIDGMYINKNNLIFFNKCISLYNSIKN